MLALSFVIAALFYVGTPELNKTGHTPSPAPPAREEPVETPEPEKPSEPAQVQKPEDPLSQEKAPQPVVRQADRSYFDDALFIGDSRTMGLEEYGDMGNAAVIADSGMSVYKVWNAEMTDRDGRRETLDSLLNKRSFGKIYLMLGINELGYDFDATVNKYEELVDTLRQRQPEAILYVEANLHITKEKSDSSEIFNNENINRFNEAVKQLADETTVFYLDVNPLFDDDQGALSADVTTDQVHILGIYYTDWVDWLLQNAVFYEKP